MRASSVLNCQSTDFSDALRRLCQAWVSRDERLLIGDTSVETLPCENGQFAFSDVEPTAMLGGVMDFEALDEPTGHLGWESFIQGGDLMGVEVVTDQHDGFRLGVVAVRADGGFLPPSPEPSCARESRFVAIRPAAR